MQLDNLTRLTVCMHWMQTLQQNKSAPSCLNLIESLDKNDNTGVTPF